MFLFAMVGCAVDETNHEVADQDKTKADTIDRADESAASSMLKELNSEFEVSFKNFEKALNEAQSAEDKKAVFQNQNPVPKLVSGLTEIANSYDQTKAGFEAALEIVSRSKGSDKNSAMQLLISKYAAKLEYKKVVQSMLDDLPSPSIESWLELLVENAPNEESEAHAKLGFARYVNQIPAFRDGFVKNPHVLAKLDKEHQEYLTRVRTDQENQQGWRASCSCLLSRKWGC